MAEVSKNASIMITTSWQALGRAIESNPDTQICDCTVVILFASLFIESNLNDIIDKMHLKKQMVAFCGNKYPGLQDKLGWFYNEFIAKKRAKSRNELFSTNIKSKLRRCFPGFAKLYRFRNDLSHGKINNTARSLDEVRELRQQAKDIVDYLFKRACLAGYTIRRDMTFQEANK